jgi:hypothetical protein
MKRVGHAAACDRQHRIDLYVERQQFARGVAGKRDDAALRRSVIGHAVRASDRGRLGDVHYLPGPFRFHEPPDHLNGAIEGSVQMRPYRYGSLDIVMRAILRPRRSWRSSRTSGTKAMMPSFLFLASSDSEYVSGQILADDGGLLA